jgi:hypothetical protein
MRPGNTSRRRQAGKGAGSKPAPGWKSAPAVFLNARSPSVPATLALSLEEYFTASALVGLLASQHDEPDHRWACQWSYKMGKTMAQEAIKRRRKKR